jgi:hypothetical protein
MRHQATTRPVTRIPQYHWQAISVPKSIQNPQTKPMNNQSRRLCGGSLADALPWFCFLILRIASLAPIKNHYAVDHRRIQNKVVSPKMSGDTGFTKVDDLFAAFAAIENVTGVSEDDLKRAREEMSLPIFQPVEGSASTANKRHSPGASFSP